MAVRQICRIGEERAGEVPGDALPDLDAEEVVAETRRQARPRRLADRGATRGNCARCARPRGRSAPRAGCRPPRASAPRCRTPRAAQGPSSRSAGGTSAPCRPGAEIELASERGSATSPDAVASVPGWEEQLPARVVADLQPEQGEPVVLFRELRRRLPEYESVRCAAGSAVAERSARPATRSGGDLDLTLVKAGSSSRR
jgi:hypothetical protein